MEIINSNSKAVTTTTNDQTMAVNMTAQAFNAILEKLYNDPLSAVIREITTNAIEAQQLSKTNKKIIIQVPNTLFSDLVFRDFGVGLDAEEINKYLNCLFSSTKDKSNQFPGGFGLGSKSPLALVDTFNITSFKNGIAYHCIWYKKEGSMPVLSIIDEEETTEENGMEVKIPLASIMKRYSNFNKDILVRIRKELYLFKDQIDFVVGYNTSDCVDINSDVWDNSITTLSSSSTFELVQTTLFRTNLSWETRSNTNLNLLVSVGNVIYPVSEELAKEAYKNNVIFHSLNTATIFLILKIDIGKLQIAPNRESIMDTPANFKLINEAVKKFKDDYFECKNKIFDALKVSKQFSKISQELSTLENTYGISFHSSTNTLEDDCKLLETTTLNTLINNSEEITSIYKSTNIQKCHVRFYTSGRQSIVSGFSTFINLFIHKNTPVTYNFILLNEDEEVLYGKKAFYHYVDIKNLKTNNTYVFTSTESVTKQLTDSILKADVEYLKYANITINIHTNSDITKEYDTYKTNNLSSKSPRIATTKTQFQGITLQEDTGSISGSSNYFYMRNVYRNNVLKKVDVLTDKTIKFGSEYLQHKKVMIMHRNDTNLPILNTSNLNIKMLDNFKDFSFICCSPGIYPQILKNLLADTSLTVYYSENKFKIPTQDTSNISVYQSLDFKYYFVSHLYDRIFTDVFESGYTGRRAYKHFVADELKEVFEEVAQDFLANSSPLENSMLDFLIKNHFALLTYRKTWSNLYEEKLDKQHQELVNIIINKLKTKVVQSDKWKEHSSDVLNGQLYSSSIVTTILTTTKLQNKPCNIYFEKI